MSECDSELSDKEKYSIYLDAHRKALECEYSEADKSDRSQLIISIATVGAAMLILFTRGDIDGRCVMAIVSGVVSMAFSQASYHLSQSGFQYYRDEVLQPDMNIDEEKQRKYRRKSDYVIIANNVSLVFLLQSVVVLVIRCLCEGAGS